MFCSRCYVDEYRIVWTIYCLLPLTSRCSCWTLNKTLLQGISRVVVSHQIHNAFSRKCTVLALFTLCCEMHEEFFYNLIILFITFLLITLSILNSLYLLRIKQKKKVHSSCKGSKKYTKLPSNLCQFSLANGVATTYYPVHAYAMLCFIHKKKTSNFSFSYERNSRFFSKTIRNHRVACFDFFFFAFFV